MASSFKKMDPAQAALIVQDLSNDMAIDLMNELSTQTRGQVLQEMDPKKAADLTERLIKKNTAAQESTP
ncbi:magnesium transporter MgtE N-terminal domain-containing protein [Aciduricibacillus chroicocephali]